MTRTAADTILNEVLISLHRSLLQYARQASLWASDSTRPLLETVCHESESQAETVNGLSDLLKERGVHVQFGQLPDYSRLNYLAVEFVLEKVITDQELVVEDCRQAISRLADAPADAELMNEIAISEEDRLSHLKSLLPVACQS